MVSVLGTPEFAAWYEALIGDEAEAVTRAIAVLEEVGTETPRARSVVLMPQLRGKVPIELFELDVEHAGMSVFFGAEADGRIVLLYGCAGAVKGAVEQLLAVRVYQEYKKESA